VAFALQTSSLETAFAEVGVESEHQAQNATGVLQIAPRIWDLAVLLLFNSLVELC